MKIAVCPEYIFRARDANLYCTKPHSHGGAHVFGDGTVRVDGVDTKPEPSHASHTEKGTSDAAG